MSPSVASAMGHEMTRFEGRSIQTELGYGMQLNKASKPTREWFVTQDPKEPTSH